MELALYCPDTGYYERDDDTVGRRGDFYTSISVGPVFGELLALQFAEWINQLTSRDEPSGSYIKPGSPKAGVPAQKFLLIEAGAHAGQLAKDILTWLQRWRSGLFAQIEYWIIEPSIRRQQWQRQSLVEFCGHVYWADSPAAIGRVRLRATGVFFANELFDAMPVRRFGWDARRRAWFEWGVTWTGDCFSWVRLPESRTMVSPPLELPFGLLECLPDGFTTEICPLAGQWWGEAAGVLACGKWLTIDYGLESEEFFAPHRTQGTLRAYRKHQSSGDPLANPGQQDLTAHVNFSQIRAAGEAAGLRTEKVSSQAQFLTGIAVRFWQSPERNGVWTAKQSRELQTLIHPQHLGRAFRVLLQTR